MNKELKEIIIVMDQVYGRDISIYDESFLEKSLERRRVASEISKTTEYRSYLEKNSIEAEAFYSSLSITYSQFFRNPYSFALLEQLIIPELISRKPNGSEIRVWSAGCSSGQEAYSIAMLLADYVSTQEKANRFRIFATDTSQTELALARDGVYDQYAVQNVKIYQLNKYFIKTGETYTVVSQLRQSINFSNYDLLDRHSANPPESIYGDFDIVFCSNLLFYYTPTIQQYIIQKIQKSMSDKGYLVTGEAERTLVEKATELQMVAIPTSIFQMNKR